MWDKDDHFGRWAQFIWALPLLLIAGILFYISFIAENSLHSPYYGSHKLVIGAIACLVLAARCLWYAITGKDNVNNKDL
jgi:peptidoglycan/LPS O-acetylase OafA/YrhL